jgi:hypothetical protein
MLSRSPFPRHSGVEELMRSDMFSAKSGLAVTEQSQEGAFEIFLLIAGVVSHPIGFRCEDVRWNTI